MPRFIDKAKLRALYKDGAKPDVLVREMHRQASSHDKLAIALRELGSKASRQRIIAWESGGGIEEPNASALSRLSGLPLEAFVRPRPAKSQVRGQLAEVYEQTLALVERAELLADRLERLLAAAEGRLGGG